MPRALAQRATGDENYPEAYWVHENNSGEKTRKYDPRAEARDAGFDHRGWSWGSYHGYHGLARFYDGQFVNKGRIIDGAMCFGESESITCDAARLVTDGFDYADIDEDAGEALAAVMRHAPSDHFPVQTDLTLRISLCASHARNASWAGWRPRHSARRSIAPASCNISRRRDVFRWQNRFPRHRRAEAPRIGTAGGARQFGGGLLLGSPTEGPLPAARPASYAIWPSARAHGGSIGAPFEEPLAQLRRRRLLFGSPSRAQRVEGVARATERAVRSPADRVAQRRHGHEERPARRNLEAELRREVRVRRYDEAAGEFRHEAQSGHTAAASSPLFDRPPTSEMALRTTRHAPHDGRATVAGTAVITRPQQRREEEAAPTATSTMSKTSIADELSIEHSLRQKASAHT